MTLAKVRWISTSKGITFWSLPSVTHLEISSQMGFGRANPFGDRFNWKILIEHTLKARFLGGSGDLANARQLSHVQCRPVRVHLKRELDAVCVCVCRTFRSYVPIICHVKCHSVANNQRQSTGSWAPIHGFCCITQVNLLLSAGASVNERSVDRYTPLLSACARGFGKARTKGSLDWSMHFVPWSFISCESRVNHMWHFLYLDHTGRISHFGQNLADCRDLGESWSWSSSNTPRNRCFGFLASSWKPETGKAQIIHELWRSMTMTSFIRNGVSHICLRFRVEILWGLRRLWLMWKDLRCEMWNMRW